MSARSLTAGSLTARSLTARSLTARSLTVRSTAVRSMTVAGIMSGTSADGIDVALVRLTPGKLRPGLTLLAHQGFRFPAGLRRAVLAAMNSSATSTAELGRLNWRLGIAYAEAVRTALKRHPVKLDLIGCHGQTLYHQARPMPYLDRTFACTWQTGEAQLLAAQLGVPVVSNFRPADMLAGGQGAPLVPLLDYVLFWHPGRGRVLQNIGGIANLTAIPAGAAAEQILAFDTGPGNMVIDQLMMELFSKRFDSNGAIARQGRVLQPVLTRALREPFFDARPPRTAGREQFGREYAEEFLNSCRKLSKRPEDAIRTATALTAESIAASYKRFVQKKISGADTALSPVDYIVSGGGARNRSLMAMLAEKLAPMGCELARSQDFGLPAEAKEAAAFALLAWQTWHRLPGNVPAATGARRAAILGQVSYV